MQAWKAGLKGDIYCSEKKIPMWYKGHAPGLGLQLSTLVVLQSTQSGGTFSTLVLRHSVVLVLGYSYSVVLSSTQLKPYEIRPTPMCSQAISQLCLKIRRLGCTTKQVLVARARRFATGRSRRPRRFKQLAVRARSVFHPLASPGCIAPPCIMYMRHRRFKKKTSAQPYEFRS